MKLISMKSKAFFVLILVLCITGILRMHTVYAKDRPEEGQLVLVAAVEYENLFKRAQGVYL